MTIYEESPNLEARALVESLLNLDSHPESAPKQAADALSAALDRAEKAEAEADKRGRILADLAQIPAFEVARVGGYHQGWNDAIAEACESIADNWTWDDADFLADVQDELRRALKKGDPT